VGGGTGARVENQADREGGGQKTQRRQLTFCGVRRTRKKEQGKENMKSLRGGQADARKPDEV